MPTAIKTKKCAMSTATNDGAFQISKGMIGVVVNLRVHRRKSARWRIETMRRLYS